MRRILAAVLPVSLIAFAFACDDSDVGGRSGLDLDAGDVDAFVPPIPQVDAAPDAPAITVTVQVLAAAGKVGVPVVFEYADGKLETIKTDANGLAVSAGSTTPTKATALLKTIGEGTQLVPVTWLAVAGGDVLQVRGFDADSAPVGRYTLTSPDTNASIRPEVTDYCGGRFLVDGAGTLDVFGACVQDDGKATLLAVRDSDGSIDGFSFLKDLALPAQAGTPQTLGAIVAADTFTVKLLAIPADSFPQASLAEVYKHRTFNPRSGELDATGNATFAFPAGFATSHQAGGMVTDFQTRSVRALVTSAPPDATKTITLDMTKLPAAVGRIVIGGTARSPTFTWTGDTAATAGGVVQILFPSKELDTQTWTFVVPPGATTVTLPALPASTDTDAFGVRADATLDDYLADLDTLAFVKTPAAVTPAVLRAKAGAFGDVSQASASDLIMNAPLPVDGEYAITGVTRALVH